MTVRTIVGRTVPDNLPCLEYPWKILVADADRWITFIIFQQDIIARLVFLDKVIFQEQGIFFCIYNNIADVCNLAD